MSNKINWSELMEANRDKIEETIREAKKETYGTMQGWHVDVEMDEDGEVWTSGLASQGSQSMSSYNGETFIVCYIESWEVDTNESEDIKHHEKLYAEYLAQKEDEDGEVWTSGLASQGSQSMSSWEGKTYVICSIESWNIEIDESEDIKYNEKLYAEFQAQKEDENGYEYVYEFMREKYPDILQEWQNDAKDYELSEFDPSEYLDRAIEDEKEYSKY